MLHLQDNQILSDLAQIATGAGDVIMNYYNKGTQVENKDDGSPVTIADRAAEAHIVKRLKEIWPDIPMVGEESVNGDIDVSKTDRYWLVDPLDGTREFINNSEEFTVNIALIEKGLPTIGVIYAPAKDLLYLGHSELGAFKSNGGSELQKLPIRPKSDSFNVVISRTHPTKGQEEAFLNSISDKIKNINLIRAGSSLKFCMVAENTASLYFRAGTTMYWDSAAGHIIAKSAGAYVNKWGTYEELTYRENQLINPAFMVIRPEWSEGILSK